MIVQKHVKRMPICFARDQVCVISIVRHFCCGSGVCWIDCSRVSYVRLINQCGRYVDKIKIFKKISGCGLYTGALNRPKITVYVCVWANIWERLTVLLYQIKKLNLTMLKVCLDVCGRSSHPGRGGDYMNCSPCRNVDECWEQLKMHVAILNQRKEEEVREHLHATINNFVQNAYYRFLDPYGCRLGRVSPENPIMWKWVG